MIYAVLDTNVLVSAAIARSSSMSVPLSIFQGIAQRRFTLVVNDSIVEEYREVLLRPKFKLGKTKVDEFLAKVFEFAINENVPDSGVILPDEDDVVFYDVAFAHQNKSAYLVTGNLKHFPECSFVISPRDFLSILNFSSGSVVNEKIATYDSSGLLAALRALNEAAEKSGAANMTDAEIEAEIKATREAHINR